MPRHDPFDPFVVKVQWPLASNAPDPEVLVYDEDRTISQLMPATKELKKFMGGAHRVFAWAWVTHQGLLYIDRLCENQDREFDQEVPVK